MAVTTYYMEQRRELKAVDKMTCVIAWEQTVLLEPSSVMHAK